MFNVNSHRLRRRLTTSSGLLLRMCSYFMWHSPTDLPTTEVVTLSLRFVVSGIIASPDFLGRYRSTYSFASVRLIVRRISIERFLVQIPYLADALARGFTVVVFDRCTPIAIQIDAACWPRSRLIHSRLRLRSSLCCFCCFVRHFSCLTNACGKNHPSENQLIIRNFCTWNDADGSCGFSFVESGQFVTRNTTSFLIIGLPQKGLSSRNTSQTNIFGLA